jgi:TonB family protein
MKASSSRSGQTLPGCRSIRFIALALLWVVPYFSSNLAAQTAAKSHRKVVSMVEPEYPPVLKNGHFEGQVRIEATVLSNGSVSHVEVKGGNPMLSQYAAQAVMKWKYAPAAAQTTEEVVFNFNANIR